MSSIIQAEDDFDEDVVLQALGAVQEATLDWMFEHGAIATSDMPTVLARAKQICWDDEDCDAEAASAFIDAAYPILSS